MIKTDCRHFRGDIPCVPHKKHSAHCSDCNYYDKTNEIVLIIKLGAIGDVIRTTPILHKLKEVKPAAKIYWFTCTPEILPKVWVDKILPVSLENIELLKCIEFDWLINLDKDPLAVSLAKQISAKKKTGFIADKRGLAEPISNEAERQKWLTGLFDDCNKENTKHYVQEIFEICGFTFNNEPYIIDIEESRIEFNIDKGKKTVGLNTGCGGRWASRLWPEEYWVELSKMLLNKGYEVVLLGGLQEDEKNLRISQQGGAKYFGHFPLNDFISLMDKCDIIVSAVTLAMHIAIGLKKQLILFNNIFNRNEFYLYDHGVILEPDFECDCYFSPTCNNNCMQYLKPERVFSAVKTL